MLNLPELTVNINRQARSDQTPRQCTLLYQTTDCFRLLEESLLFEGMEAPAGRICSDDTIADQLPEIQSDLIFIECKSDPVARAKALKHLVPRHALVVIIGWEDKMSTARGVEQIGFYYLLWPACKEDIVSMLHHATNDLKNNQGPNHGRAAMRIGVVGLKGGSGCTMITSELAYGLAQESQQQVIVVDHSYHGSNMHIMLGKRDLAHRKVTAAGISQYGTGNIPDQVSAQSQLAVIDPGIHFLGLESDTLNADELREYSDRILTTLVYDANFILEDYSASVKFYPHPKELCDLVDCVVMVVQPSLSGLHESRAFMERFREINSSSDHPSRLIVVVNHSTSGNPISVDVIEEFLGRPVDIILPYYKNVEEFLTSGKRFVQERTKLTEPFRQLSRQILGKQPMAKSFFARLFS